MQGGCGCRRRCAVFLWRRAAQPRRQRWDLIAVARRGLDDARTAQQAQNQTIMKQYASQQSSLDAAFDADVRLAAGGQIKDAAGSAVTLTPEWVISARKGYVAARDAIAAQAQATQTANATRLDNLKAADEALDMATQLILQQQALGLRASQLLLSFQRKVAHGN